MQLGDAAQRQGYGLTVYDTIGSTNDAALATGRHRHWFVARAQSAGRGRSGRAWTSVPGNLYATLLLHDPCEPAHLPKLGFVAGVSLRQAVAALAPDIANLRLKWPNDLLADGAKLAGILLEARSRQAGGTAVAIGFGVNCSLHPSDTPYPAASLASLGAQVSPEALLAALADRMAVNIEIFARAAGFATIRDAWIEGAHSPGSPIAVSQSGSIRRGAFAGIDADGRLLFDDEKGRATIDAADVLFPVSPLAANP